MRPAVGAAGLHPGRSAGIGERGRLPPFALLGLASLAFVGLGLPDDLLGVAWPSLRDDFALPLDALGALLALSCLAPARASPATPSSCSR